MKPVKDNEFKVMIDAEKENCNQQLREWQAKLKLAESQVKYWEMQVDAMRTVSTRLMLDGWKADAEKEESKLKKGAKPQGSVT